MTFYIASHVEFETRKMRRQRSDIVYLSDRRDMLSGAVCVNQEARGLRNTLLMGLFSGLPTIIAHDSLCWVALGKPLSPSWSSPYSDVAFHWDFGAVVRQTSVSLIINTHSAFELLLQSLHQVLVMTILNMLCACVLPHTYPEKEVLISGMLNWKKMMCFVKCPEWLKVICKTWYLFMSDPKWKVKPNQQSTLERNWWYF